MREIGGYFELECARGNQYHNGIFLNSGRNALRCIVQLYGIKKIWVPYFTCPVVEEALLAENCELHFYDVDEQLMPMQDFESDAYIIYNNYFGVCGNNVKKLAAEYPKLIVDKAQAFFFKNSCFASIYSPRKFFGVPDGGIAVCDKQSDIDFEVDCSFERCSHLLKRLDCGAGAGYNDFHQNSAQLRNAPIKQMSNLTRAMLGGIDYESAKKRRLANFQYLHSQLHSSLAAMLSEDDVPMVYPLLTNDKTLRKKLIGNKIFVARYWPTDDECQSMKSEKAQYLADSIIPLPIDQRYDIKDMKRITEVLHK